MKRYNYAFLVGFMGISAIAANPNEGREELATLLNDMVANERHADYVKEDKADKDERYNRYVQELAAKGKKIKKDVTWDDIFATMDRYSINPATFRYRNWFSGHTISFLSLVVSSACTYRGTFNEKNPCISCVDDAKRALKIIVEKYNVFKRNSCRTLHCDNLFAIALQSNTWGTEEPGRPNLDVVHLLLEYGAKPGKEMSNIRRAKTGSWTRVQVSRR